MRGGWGVLDFRVSLQLDEFFEVGSAWFALVFFQVCVQLAQELVCALGPEVVLDQSKRLLPARVPRHY